METDEDDELDRNKHILQNLKRAIEHEKNRLLRVTAPPTMESEAAEMIQKHWRGYLTRKRFPIVGKAERDAAELFPELEQSDSEAPVKHVVLEEETHDEAEGDVLC
jgi:hypothetical protein